MYVIWRKRKREKYASRSWFDKVGDVRLTPIIVQSRRVNGKPKQEHIACLPSIVESDIDEKTAVWFWKGVEERLARLTNRISHEDAENIRAALGRVVPPPAPEYAKELKAASDAHFNAMVSALSPKSEATREANKRIVAFSSSFKTAKICADCGEELKEVYRERRTFGFGFMGGMQWTTGVLCKKCSNGGPYGHRRFGPCETCERPVFIGRSIPALHAFCSTRCGQAYYRKARLGRVRAALAKGEGSAEQ